MRLYTYSIKIIFLVLCISGQEMGQVGIQRGARKDNRGLEIGGSYGYQYGGAFTVYDGDANIIDTKNYGFYLVIPLPIGRGKQLEINYSRQDTRLELTTYNTGRFTGNEGSNHYRFAC